MRHIRDLFVQGFPPWLIAHTVNVSNMDLRRHSWYHNWWRRRSYNLPSPRHIALVAALARLRDSWDQFTPSTPDKMLSLLAKLASAEALGGASFWP